MAFENIMEYVKGFIGAIIGFAIAVNVIPVGLSALSGINTTQVPLLAVGIVGTVLGAGVLFFLLSAFMG
jgi:hypothetical protein